MTNKSMIGKRFRSESRVSFTVLEGTAYPANQITPRYRKYLTALRPQYLVGISFYGMLTPLITTKEGVIRLTKIKIGNETYEKAGDISRMLGLKTAKELKALELL